MRMVSNDGDANHLIQELSKMNSGGYLNNASVYCQIMQANPVECKPPLTQVVRLPQEPPLTQVVRLPQEPPLTQVVRLPQEPPLTQVVRLPQEPPLTQVDKSSPRDTDHCMDMESSHTSADAMAGVNGDTHHNKLLALTKDEDTRFYVETVLGPPRTHLAMHSSLHSIPTVEQELQFDACRGCGQVFSDECLAVYTGLPTPFHKFPQWCRVCYDNGKCTGDGQLLNTCDIMWYANVRRKIRKHVDDSICQHKSLRDRVMRYNSQVERFNELQAQLRAGVKADNSSRKKKRTTSNSS